MIDPKKLNPLGRMCVTLGALPSSYKQSLTYEEQILWISKFLEEEVLPAVNNNAEGLDELQQLYIELKAYVEDYFKDLDVQEEINEKLDEMAESGELTEIIEAYLNLHSILGFNTKADMKAGTNFVNGSFAKTLGATSYLDGDGSLYKIRTKLSTDVVDETNIVALTNFATLIAELIPDGKIEEVYETIGDLTELETTEKTEIVGAINEVVDDTETIDGKIGTLSSLTTTTKTNTVSAINEVNGKINELNLTVFKTYAGSQMTASVGTIASYSSLTVARNSTGSVAKIYGNIFNTIPALGTVTVTITNTGLTPETDITILNAGVTFYNDSSVIGEDMLIKTDGSIVFTLYQNATANNRHTFIPSLYFIKDFGDTPISE